MTPELSTTGGTSDGRFIAKVCPQVVEFGPLNATIHQIDERVELASLEPLTAIYQRTLENFLRPAVNIRALIDDAARRLAAAGVSFGHGTTNAFDEAVWLVLWRLGLPLDELDNVADLPVDVGRQAEVEALIDERIERRIPAAYLTGEAWLQGVPFTVDARAIVPRSLIAEPLADGTLDAWLLAGHHARARPVHRQRQPGRAGGAGLARGEGRRHRPVGRRAGGGRAERGAPRPGRPHHAAPGRRPGRGAAAPTTSFSATRPT